MSRARGNDAEEAACAYLVRQGCRILERNFYFKGGEIDIVAEKGGIVHFVEVKSGDSFEPLYNLTPVKVRRVVNGAQTWLKKRKLDLPWQVDALIVRGGECEWLENITM
ncbi:YraN family protein [Hydrogenimonas sp.]